MRGGHEFTWRGGEVGAVGVCGGAGGKGSLHGGGADRVDSLLGGAHYQAHGAGSPGAWLGQRVSGRDLRWSVLVWA